MKIIKINLKKSLNKAFLKQRPSRTEIDDFKTNLIVLIDKIKLIEKRAKDESEEHLKNDIRDFLRDTFYKEINAINTKDKKDLVIHLDKTTSSNVGVVIEAKRPSNKIEMISADNPNTKALHELILYYLDERINADNDQLKQLIITNVNEWYIIDANYFDKHIYRNTQIRKLYETKINDKKDNPFFYEEISKIISKTEIEIPCIYFDIRDYEMVLRNLDKTDDKNLIALQKILSPYFILKIPFANDSNSLNEKFYKELLYIIGLEEEKSSSKIIIQRKNIKQAGSLIENAINILNTEDTLLKIKDKTIYGQTRDEQLYNIALELSLTWINRILFLKLLEGQLISYHKGNKEYGFLNTETISDYNELYNLFHQVLAKEMDKRTVSIKQKYLRIPYLNSSLFDFTELEEFINIKSLDNSEKIEILNTTVLKEEKKRYTHLPTLEYLFKFLEAYDFTSEGGEDIAEDNKSIITASVLGKVFEKINGYKDGSIFTPGFITMYMSRQALRFAVVQRFNEFFNQKGISEVNSFEELYNRIEKVDLKTANEIIKSLRICDPAVGSGHYLVSALNELIVIKSELGILVDKNGKRLKDYEIVIENDELIISDENGIFEYNYQNKESQRVQEAIFNERQTIIENCLFGVDINPNSVKICRLRLWIELLKSSYYKSPNFIELETLPNIDINIKCGNSLISRYALDADLKKALQKSKWSITSYRLAVTTYRNAKSKEEKRTMEVLIDEIKNNFEIEILQNDKRFKKLYDLKGELFTLTNQGVIFDKSRKEKADWNKKVENLTLALKIQEDLIEEIRSNVIYKNSFEWRFEFPEALNDNGDFDGFDVIIGNPPYIPLEAFTNTTRAIFRDKYEQVERKYDTSILFILEGYKLLKAKGILSYIAPITWQTGENYSKLRKFFISNFGIDCIINLPFNTFESAYVETSIYSFIKEKLDAYKIFNFKKKDNNDNLEKIDFVTVQYSQIKEPNYKIILDTSSNIILERFSIENYVSLGQITKSTQGLSGSRFLETKQKGKEIYPFLKKGNVYNYELVIQETYLTDLSEKKSLQQFYQNEEKVLIRRIVNRQDRLTVGFTNIKMVFKKDINPFIVIDKDFSTKYILAILASKYISYLYINSSTIATKDDFRQTTLAELRSIPIRKISLSEQKPFIDIVDQILDAKHQKKSTIKLENKIDKLVYKLYGIKEEEIEIIENIQR